MLILTNANKILSDTEILEKFAEIFYKRIKPESTDELLNAMNNDFMLATMVIGYIIGESSAYVKGYMETHFQKRKQ